MGTASTLGNAMTQIRDTAQTSQVLETFLKSIEAQTTDVTHLRLIKAARKSNPAASVERELVKVMEEILNEA
jgi:hypothetical protein